MNDAGPIFRALRAPQRAAVTSTDGGLAELLRESGGRNYRAWEVTLLEFALLVIVGETLLTSNSVPATDKVITHIG